MINAGIIGASGYTGGELMRLLLKHPEVNIVAATSRNLEGKPVSDHHRQLKGFLDLEFQDLGPEDIKASDDAAFLAVPHGAAMDLMPGLLEGKLKGAAGQAIQNMNLMCGFDEKAGLWAAAANP